ncbi:MAG: hypothetical protein QOH56_365 [Pseudonocardiales bacterium]|jgi:hypothetical protein|nr:hypothetical protein [Pseudonocardiales bacterium]
MQINELQSRIDKLEGQTDQLADEHIRIHDTVAATIAINNHEVKRQLEDFERGLVNRERRTFG